MDLFDLQINNENYAPLSERMRPENFEKFVGQSHIMGENRSILNLIKKDMSVSMIFYGPPGSGKTTLANIISKITKRNFVKLSAVNSGVKDVKKVIDDANYNLKYENVKTVLFIDEIHRFNKSQQDILLPYVESGLITLIGATTENPFFEINSALLSRCKIIQFEKISQEDIVLLLKRAVFDRKNGFGNLLLEISDDILKNIAKRSNGDVRNAYNTLENIVLSAKEDKDGFINITIDNLNDYFESLSTSVVYDKNMNYHYDYISAFIKSIRGSDPQAAIYYLAYMLSSGEDPKFIGRRLIILASEDIGNADPNALQVALSAFKAVEVVGMPEARIILAQAVTYLSAAPKSNSSYIAIKKADELISKLGYVPEIPQYLKDNHYQGADELNIGKGYQYPHNYEGGFVKQQYLPENIKDENFYEPKDIGFESKIKEILKKFYE